MVRDKKISTDESFDQLYLAYIKLYKATKEVLKNLKEDDYDFERYKLLEDNLLDVVDTSKKPLETVAASYFSKDLKKIGISEFDVKYSFDDKTFYVHVKKTRKLTDKLNMHKSHILKTYDIKIVDFKQHI